MVENSENSKLIIQFSAAKNCPEPIAKLCLEASGYNMDIAFSIYESSYPPSKNPLIYCGKFVGDWDHYYKKNYTNGQCGPTNGPNCEACRKKYNPNLPQINDENRKVWQGKSGRFYCGVFFGVQDPEHHNGYCGPNNGLPCPSCKKLIK